MSEDVKTSHRRWLVFQSVDKAILAAQPPLAPLCKGGCHAQRHDWGIDNPSVAAPKGSPFGGTFVAPFGRAGRRGRRPLQ